MSYKEVFKVITGAAIWDFLIGLWFIFWGEKPITFFWISFNLAWLIVVVAIDFVIILVLGYFAWFYKEKKKSHSRAKNRSKRRR